MHFVINKTSNEHSLDQLLIFFICLFWKVNLSNIFKEEEEKWNKSTESRKYMWLNDVENWHVKTLHR